MEKITDNSVSDANEQVVETKPAGRLTVLLSKLKAGKLAVLLSKLKSGITPSFREKLSSLTISQWFYFVAFICLLSFVNDIDEEDNALYIVGILAGLGMLREFLQLFHRVWQKILGKGLILVLYAGTANFALAVSAIKINAIAGIEPSPFIFTLGFTTLIMLPFWLTVVTVAFFSIALICVNLWLLVSILLRIVRIKIQVHWEDRSFVFLTMFLRLILIPLVIMTLGIMIKPYAKQIEAFNGANNMFTPNQFSSQQLEQIDNAGEEEVIALIKEFRAQNAAQLQLSNDNVSDSSDESNQASESESKSENNRTRYLDTMVATFIYWFEAYPYSKCLKLPQQRSLIIDENLMLLVEKDNSELGYKFAVQACVPRYENHRPIN
jgi:hypothetical protein